MTNTSRSPDPGQEAWPRADAVNLPTAATSTGRAQGPVSIRDLQERTSAVTARNQQAILAMTEAQLQSLADQLVKQARIHAKDLRQRTLAELRSTANAIDEDLAVVRASSRRARTQAKALVLWPPITAVAVSLLIVIVALAIGWNLAGGIASQTITTPDGQQQQILTGSEWQTCQWQGQPHPCRPVQP